jgi:hypothetical protein
MRNSILAVAAILSFAGCGSSGTNPGSDGGIKLDGGGGNVDLSGGGAVDLTPPQLIGCMDLIACTNACTTQACLTKCHKMATTQANTLNKNLDDCITAFCVTAPDGGMGPCAGTDQTACNTCVMNSQSGKSPTGMTNGTCTPTSDPVCGFCVDQLIACANDLTM